MISYLYTAQANFQHTAGMLRTLDLSGFNLTCSWSQIATPIASLTSLVVLDLSQNPLLTVSVPDYQESSIYVPVQAAAWRCQLGTSLPAIWCSLRLCWMTADLAPTI